jgi:hexosaminidase
MVVACATSCQRSQPASPEAKLAFESVIPKPSSAVVAGESFIIKAESKVVAGQDKEVQAIAEYLVKEIQKDYGIPLPVASEGGDDEGTIRLNLKNESALGDEGYKLVITPDHIDIDAQKPAGLFYGVQTLRQLLPVKHNASDTQLMIAAGTITDKPEYGWRGSMLDVARHFFTVEEIKRYIDYISMYKMNILHLHLTDDQGWRIEIKSWPELTKVGGSTEVGGGKGGFYTQEQYKDIVQYAQQRYVTIVPEIDLPGHINSALASYPTLLLPASSVKVRREPASSPNAKDKPVPGTLYTGIEVGFSTLTFQKEETFKFVDDVLRELAAITPGPYLHVGGDEAAATKKEDYIAFINKFTEMVKAHGKKMIGWEEIAQGNINDNVIAQHWHSADYAKLATGKGAKLILSPSRKCYLDMQYDSTSKLGLHWAAYIEVDSSYLWDPATLIPGISKSDVVGVEAPLWSETIADLHDIEYLLFPRLPGIAEIGWTSATLRSWPEYKVRLARQAPRWHAEDINFYASPKVDWEVADVKK